MGILNYNAFILENVFSHCVMQTNCLCVHIIPTYMCGWRIALVLFDASRWPIELIKYINFVTSKTFLF